MALDRQPRISPPPGWHPGIRRPTMDEIRRLSPGWNPGWNQGWNKGWNGRASAAAAGGVPTANLVLDFDAHNLVLNSGDPVSLWPDASPSGANASQGTASLKPTYYTNLINGRPAVAYDGTNDYLENLTFNPIVAGGARSVYYVGVVWHNAAIMYIVNFHRASGADWTTSFNSDGVNTYVYRTAVFPNRQYVAGNIIPGTSPFLYTARAAGVGVLVNMRLNGVQKTVAGGVTLLDNSAANGFYIGGVPTQSARGYIGRILVYAANHDDTVVAEVELALSTQWGL